MAQMLKYIMICFLSDSKLRTCLEKMRMTFEKVV